MQKSSCSLSLFFLVCSFFFFAVDSYASYASQSSALTQPSSSERRQTAVWVGGWWREVASFIQHSPDASCSHGSRKSATCAGVGAVRTPLPTTHTPWMDFFHRLPQHSQSRIHEEHECVAVLVPPLLFFDAMTLLLLLLLLLLVDRV
jgi:hypothetical protein